MSSPESFDAIVVGAGQAGPAIAARCARKGLRTAVIERHHVGGTCVNAGCMPTKALVATARAIALARRGADFGFDLPGGLHVDMPRVMARKDAIVQQSRANVEAWIRGMPHTELVRGDACFVDRGLLQVGERRLRAPRIFLNVGGRPLRPPIAGLDSVPTLDSTSILALHEVPEHLVVIGGSYIGLEFAQVMRRFGADVTVIERLPRLLPREDEDVSAGVQALLEREGIRIVTGAECIRLAPNGAHIAVGAACAGGMPPVTGSHVLLAVGRRPNTDGLGLELAGIATDERGYITVDNQCRTSAEGVWAVGDCNGRGAFTHTAWHDHEIVVGNLFDDDRRRIGDRIPCYALFTDPPLARVGLTDTEARARGWPLLHAKLPMHRVGRAREAGETQGFMKVIVDAESEQILGATLLGLSADEVVHTLLNAMAAGTPYTAIARTVQIHPTVSELLPTLLQQLAPWP